MGTILERETVNANEDPNFCRQHLRSYERADRAVRRKDRAALYPHGRPRAARRDRVHARGHFRVHEPHGKALRHGGGVHCRLSRFLRRGASNPRPDRAFHDLLGYVRLLPERVRCRRGISGARVRCRFAQSLHRYRPSRDRRRAARPRGQVRRGDQGDP